MFTVMYDVDDDGYISRGMRDEYETFEEAIQAKESMRKSPCIFNIEIIQPQEE